jgi:hypothetical protein
MISRDWDWSDIVNPQLVELALAHQEQRAQRRRQRANDDSAAEHNDHRPVAA